MDHKLLIKIKYTKNNKYTGLLEDIEFPRQFPLSITFDISNIGMNEFNGWIDQINLIYFNQNIPKTIKVDDPHHNISPLSIGSSKKYESIISAPIEGYCWVECIIKSVNDDDTIEYHTNNGKRSIGKKSWKQLFSIVNREQLEIILLLQAIQNKLK